MNTRKNTGYSKSGYSNRPFNNSLLAPLGNKGGQHRPKISMDDAALPAVNNNESDGVNHFNVHHHGLTDLGKALSMHGEYPLIHPQYGSFLTVFGLIAWLSNPNQPDSYRLATAKDIDASLRANPEKTQTHMSDFALQVMQGTWYKIKSHPKIENWLKTSELRFDHYFIYVPKDPTTGKKGDPVRVRNPSSAWMIKGMEELRAALKENREPDFTIVLPHYERERIQRQRQTEAKKKERETDVILNANLQKPASAGNVQKERTPEEIERKRAKQKAKRERRNERQDGSVQHAALTSPGRRGDQREMAILRDPPLPREPSDGPNLCQETPQTGSELSACVLGIKDIYVQQDPGGATLTVNLNDVQARILSTEQRKEFTTTAVNAVLVLADKGESVTTDDIDWEFVTNVGGTLWLGLLRLNGVVPVEEPAEGIPEDEGEGQEGPAS